MFVNFQHKWRVYEDRRAEWAVWRCLFGTLRSLVIVDELYHFLSLINNNSTGGFNFDVNKQQAEDEVIMLSHPAFYSKPSTRGGVQTAPVLPVESKQLSLEEAEPYIFPLN